MIEKRTNRLNVYILVDACSAMGGNRIGTINATLEEWIPEWFRIEKETDYTDIYFRIMGFGTEAFWTSKMEQVDELLWEDIQASGLCNLGAALKLLTNELKIRDSSTDNYKTVIILFLGNQPTDNVYDAIDNISANEVFKRAMRIIVKMGNDIDENILERISGGRENIYDAKSCYSLIRNILFCLKHDDTDFDDRYKTLSEIISLYPNIWEDLRRFKSILADCFPNEKKLRNLLYISAEEKIPQDILGQEHCTLSDVHRFSNRIVESIACDDEIAESITVLWMNVLNRKIENSMRILDLNSDDKWAAWN